jgi:hypothetical protein
MVYNSAEADFVGHHMPQGFKQVRDSAMVAQSACKMFGRPELHDGFHAVSAPISRQDNYTDSRRLCYGLACRSMHTTFHQRGPLYRE